MKLLIISSFFLFSFSFSISAGEKKKSCCRRSLGKKGVGNNSYLNLLFSEKERKDIQFYLEKDYHARKRREEIQMNARLFFKKLVKWENQKALKNNNEIKNIFRRDKKDLKKKNLGEEVEQ